MMAVSLLFLNYLFFLNNFTFLWQPHLQSFAHFLWHLHLQFSLSQFVSLWQPQSQSSLHFPSQSQPSSQSQSSSLDFADEINDNRFIPYIQLHEFEALLFCGIEYIAELYPGCEKRCEQLTQALQNVGNPELINNSPHTAPSKRIIKAIEGDNKTHYNYNKPKTGRFVTEKIGIDELRSKCKHFDEWIEKLIIY